MLQGFSIYPNPVSVHKLKITLHNTDQAESFVILNGARQVVKKEYLSNNNSEVDVSVLNSGIYMVKIQFSNDFYQIEKLIVK
ncbi:MULTISPECIES: T9SS type A sorting domain-containing protein [unclassified Lentimicrobium]|uniref:T9SS type A sorting domain-containing protein n=1 Tax=unclassified Lentimicrobium TaxID=2677434 RepID=UPI001551B5D8|nr:T9SS type A sorting domain-containing protein [Lentimicrobium sp. S6]NPD86309.1 T9SS type A sorting domain-containing protein [Lentimicrobium sp. L6]